MKMNQSESIASLAKALSLLQGEVKDVLKDKKGFNYSYGDLGQALEIARPLLCKNGLSISQFPINDGDKVGIKSKLLHESGEWMSESFCVTVERPPLNKHGKESMTMIQVIGSMLTYIRRYATTAILGITQVDDDGSLGADANVYEIEKHSSRPPINPLPRALPPLALPQRKVTDGTYAALCSSMMSHAISEETQEKWKGYFKVKNLSELSENNAKAILNQIKKQYYYFETEEAPQSYEGAIRFAERALNEGPQAFD